MAVYSLKLFFLSMTLHEMDFTNYVNGTNAIRRKQENKLIVVVVVIVGEFLKIKNQTFCINYIAIINFSHLIHRNELKMFSERVDTELKL